MFLDLPIDMRLLIICPYPSEKAPSQRFRFEQYLDGLNVSYKQVGFWSDSEWPKIYQSGNLGFKVSRTLMAFVRRFCLLFSVWKYDKVFVHREATPIGPPWFEWFVVKVFRKPLVFDFDDAVWLANASAANAGLVGRLKSHDKVGKICRWAETVVVGNEFLAEFARSQREYLPRLRHPTSTSSAQALQRGKVIVVPTTIDTEGLHNRELYSSFDTTRAKARATQDDIDEKLLTIGWTGTHSTLKQLVPIFPLLEEVYKEQPFRFLLIADEAPAEKPHFVEFRKWNKATEIPDLMRMDIGIMPLFDTDWERGKCGFKALQYMALGIPAVVSGVGVNPEIVEHGKCGFVCDTMPIKCESSWGETLILLLRDNEFRQGIGKSGRDRIEKAYSCKEWKEQYECILQGI